MCSSGESWWLEVGGKDPALYSQDKLWKGGRREWSLIHLPGYDDPAAKAGPLTEPEGQQDVPAGRGPHHPETAQIKELLEIHHSITKVLESMGHDVCKAYADTRLEVVLDQINSTDLDCKVCGKHYKSSSRMKNHFRKRHLGKTKHQCKVCKKFYTDSSSLRHHMDTHDAKKYPHKCDKCTKSYSTKSKLAQHKPVHEKAQFVCKFKEDGCDREFKWKKGKNDHEPKCIYNPEAPEEAPHGCAAEHCNKRYWDKRSLQRYYRDHINLSVQITSLVVRLPQYAVLAMRFVHHVWITVYSNVLTICCAACADNNIYGADLDVTCADNNVEVFVYKIVLFISSP